MRTIDLPNDAHDDDGSWIGAGPAPWLVDWKESPERVFEAVDDLLKPFGLEIVQYDTGADDYLFFIGKIEPAKSEDA